MADKPRSRRRFLRLFAILGGFLGLTPFVPSGRFLIEPSSTRISRQLIGNVSNFPPNSRGTFIYPKTEDEEKDSDPFRRNLLIRLEDGRFKAYSNVCVHLWCLADYKTERKQIECPCHGSMYRAETGVAFAGPASMQENNALPEVELEIDEQGRIFAVGRDGIVGYGRKTRKA